ncbi:MAG: Gfo/Idh/MocA family oxidoreductase [Planctomycetes bacterium]|nr:Gfo/Idh/MocA family oxidoreductase [Planctomycetota bacterium]
MSETTLRFGILGSLGRGSSFIRPLRAHGAACITALCDIRTEALREQAERLEMPHTFTDAEALLDSGLVDAVVVGTPMQFHVPQSILALERGIHVLSEVPVGVSIPECHDLAAAVRRSRARYMMAENACYFSDCVLVREIARAGLFGRLTFGEGEYTHELKSLNEKTPWRRRWQTGINGNTYPTHSLGPLLQWFRDQRVVSVSCVGTGNHYLDPRGVSYENEDATFTLCRLSGGGLIKLRLDMLSNRPACSACSLQGTEGCYEAPRGLGDQPKIWLKSRHGEMRWQPLRDMEGEFLPQAWRHPPIDAREAGHSGSDFWAIQDFITAVLEESDPPIGIHRALDMTLPGLASQVSIDQDSQWVAVPDSRAW